MNDFGAVLERFNRKERNLLVRAILGHSDEQRLELSEGFRKQIAECLDIESIPADVWWATDYHISWLAGALLVFSKENFALGQVQPNPFLSNLSNEPRRLVEGNQEDVDLVVASQNNLIFVEAKAYGAWTEHQVRSKLARLELLHRFYHELMGGEECLIQFRFLLTSPHEPHILYNISAPDWAIRAGKPAWMRLDIADSVLIVTRCNDRGRSDASGDYWCVAEH